MLLAFTAGVSFAAVVVHVVSGSYGVAAAFLAVAAINLAFAFAGRRRRPSPTAGDIHA